MAFYSRKFGQFRYFSTQLDQAAWHDKDVLDFGGNVGNMLRDPYSTICQHRYWCIDVDHKAIEHGRQNFPEAHWYSYNRHCFFFNSEGIPALPIPSINQHFDYIVAYSVFTNTTRDDMQDMVEQLFSLLKPGGRFAFTFIDPHYHSWPNSDQGNNLVWRLKQIDQPIDKQRQVLEQTKKAQWFTLVNGEHVYYESAPVDLENLVVQESCYSYYSSQYMQELYPEARILPPVNSEMQHCCILTQLP